MAAFQACSPTLPLPISIETTLSAQACCKLFSFFLLFSFFPFILFFLLFSLFSLFSSLQSMRLHAKHPDFHPTSTTSLKAGRPQAGQEHPDGDAALDLNSAASPHCCRQTELVREQTLPHAHSWDDSHPAPFAWRFCNPSPAFTTGRALRTGAGRRTRGGKKWR